MPKLSNIELKKSEKNTIERFFNTERQAQVLQDFFNKGFRNFIAFKTIVWHYDNTVPENDIKLFWEVRKMNDATIAHFEMIFEKLNQE